MTVTVRDATLDDYDFVMDAFRKAHGEIRDMDPDLYVNEYPQIDQWKYAANIFLRDLFKNTARCLKVAEIGGVPVGAVFAEEHPPNGWSSFNRHLCLDVVFVEKEHRRSGVATELINAVQEWRKAAGYDYMFAKISENNKASLALFEGVDCQILMAMDYNRNA